ncbi:MAG: polysaccharide/polyol phosphate ABC transporter ATPase [Acidobacteria bacterium OLB17]|nr:MAG: polysaccharide/polyol phosphate ABC transporter ATPase [Acidobacteria bacterium OLB17]
MGIIGRNGAGKSTLLKILSRITPPTRGSASIAGRVGSLLEVGTGFHNELTGRENIYLNGAILGMRRSEIDERFDEIVAFSELERFLDTPVKHYSSGMYMRLAFSVAAHLEPEVLIVDEVLAVGDLGFQKKCLGKMKDLGETGRTVLFVSHDMNSISRLCTRAIWLRDGKIAADGPAAETVAAYLHEQTLTGAERFWADAASAPGNETARIVSLRVVNAKGETVPSPDIRERIGVEIVFDALEGDKVLIPNLHFFDDRGTCIFISHDWNSGWRDRPRPAGRHKATAWIPGNLLAEGTISVTAAVSTYKPLIVHFVARDAVAFSVVDSLEGDSARGDYAGLLPGVVRPMLEWTSE